MIASRSLIATEFGSRYLGQLCAHFAHKIPVTKKDDQGEINFPIGQCRLSADSTELRIELAATSEGDLLTLQDVVARHLLRFAFRSPFEIEWQSLT